MNEFKLWKERAERLTENMWYALNAHQVKEMLQVEYGLGGFGDTFADNVTIESKIRFVVEKHLKQRGFKIDPNRKWDYTGDISEYIPYFDKFSLYPPTLVVGKAMDIYVNRDDVNFVRFPIKKNL